MAGLRKFNNSYYARVRKWDGSKQSERLIPLKTSKKTDAIERLLQINRVERDIKNGIDFSFPWLNEKGRLEVKRYTLKTAIEEYLLAREKEGLRSGTLDIYGLALDNLIRVCSTKLPVEKIKTNHIEIFKDMFKNRSNEYLNINLRAVKTFFNWLVDKDIIPEPPRIKLVKIPKKPPMYFSESEWNKLMTLDYTKLKSEYSNILYPELIHYQKAWFFYINTGCRLSEPFKGQIKGNWLIVDQDSSKTKIMREIRLNKELKRIVIEMQARLNNHLKNNKSEIDFIKRYSRIFKSCCLLVGIKNKHFHHIRHTFAVRRYLEIRDIYQVAKELGHASVTTTEIYAKFNMSKLEEDFPKLLNGNNSEKLPKFAIRDMSFRDMPSRGNTIARG